MIQCPHSSIHPGVTMTPEGQGAGQPQGYLAYLLRLWRESDAGSSGWRASLESSLTGQCRLYASLETLIAFLRQRTAEGWAQDQVEDTAGQEAPPT